MAENVAVRSQPQTSAPVVDTLSNEIATLSFGHFSRTQPERIVGWINIRTPQGKVGYVPTNQAFQIIGGYNAVFEQEGDRWLMTRFMYGE